MKNKMLLLGTVVMLIICVACTPTNPTHNLRIVSETTAESEDRPIEESIVYADDVIRIGVSMQGLQRPYIQRVYKILLQEEKNYKGKIQLTIYDGYEDAERQNAQIEKFITQKVDVIIFNPIAYDGGKIGLQMANESGIPIVLLITNAEDGFHLADAYAISDHKESAYIQMDMVAEYLGYKGNIAILKGKKGMDSEIQRSKGYAEKLQQYSDIKLVCSQVANWSAHEAKEIVENWIVNGKKIDAVLAQNDIMAMGVLEAVREAGKLSEIAVFGIDGDYDTLKLIKDNIISGTVYHDAYNQGKRAIEYAIALANGDLVTSEYVPFMRVDRSNVDYFIALEE